MSPRQIEIIFRDCWLSVYRRSAGDEDVNPGAPGLIKIGAKVVTHSGYVIFQMAEVAVPRDLFAAILDRIQRFGVPPSLVRHG